MTPRRSFRFIALMLLAAVFAACCPPTLAQDTPPDEEARQVMGARPDAATRPRPRLALLPIVFSSPDTRLALGVLPQYIFHTAAGTRPSNLRADIYYTRNRQFNVLLQPAVWLPGNVWQISGKIRLRKWPTTFEGAAPVDGELDKESFTEMLASGSAEVLRQVSPRAWIGASYAIRWGSIRQVEPANGYLATGLVPGAGRSRVASVGVVTTFDDREHLYLPRSGAIYRVHAQVHSPWVGSDRAFGSLTLDLRKYLSIAGPVTAAVQGVFTASTGDVPFRVMPSVGEVVRGFPSTRNIGRQRWAVQAEVRAIPVWWRLGFSVFAGFGDVADRIGDFRLQDAQFAFGAGVRFLMFPKERITIRQDFAFADGAGGDYLDLNEAF